MNYFLNVWIYAGPSTFSSVSCQVLKDHSLSTGFAGTLPPKPLALVLTVSSCWAGSRPNARTGLQQYSRVSYSNRRASAVEINLQFSRNSRVLSTFDSVIVGIIGMILRKLLNLVLGVWADDLHSPSPADFLEPALRSQATEGIT